MRRATLALCLLVLVATPAFASSIQIGATGVHRTDFNIGVFQSLAQDFTLTAQTKIDSIFIAISGSSDSTQTYQLSITDSLSLTGPNYWSTHSYAGFNTFSPAGLVLGAGTYYLIMQPDFAGTAGQLTVGCNPGTGIGCTAPEFVVKTETGGSVGTVWFYDGSQFDSGSWSGSPYYVANFLVEGSDPVPEPASFVLLGIGLAAAVLTVRRRNRS